MAAKKISKKTSSLSLPNPPRPKLLDDTSARVSADMSERKNENRNRQFFTVANGDLVGEADAVNMYRRDALNAAKSGVRLDASQSYYTRNPGKVSVFDETIRADQRKEKARKTKQRER